MPYKKITADGVRVEKVLGKVDAIQSAVVNLAMEQFKDDQALLTEFHP